MGHREHDIPPPHSTDRVRQIAALGSLAFQFLVAVPAAAQQPEPVVPASPGELQPYRSAPPPGVESAPPPELAPAPPVREPESSAGPFAPDEERLMDNHPIDSTKATVKPGTGFEWKSADGDFSFAPRLRAQFLYELEKEEGVDAAQSIQFRRARLQFKGNFYGRSNKYKVEFAVSPGDISQSDGAPPGTSILLDWYWDFTQLRDLTLRVGQYKVPFSRQRVVSSGDLEMVDRSIVNAEFSLDRDIGVDLRSEDLFGLDMLRYYLGVYAGEGRNTRSFYDLGMMYLGRVEFLPLGTFEDYAEADFERLSSPKLSVGVAAAHLTNGRFNRGILGSQPSDGGTTDYNTLSADAVFRFGGLSASTEWMFRNGDRDFGAEGDLEGPRDGYGGMVQLSYLVPTTRFQISGRYGFIEPAGDASVLSGSDEIGGALSYYFAQHPFKIQADFFRIGEDGGEVHNHRARVQLQASY
jgi:phosphate-selective porin OprO and OprP